MTNRKPDIENEFAEFWIDRGATKYLQTNRKTGNIIPALKEYYVARAKLKSTGEKSFVIAGNGEIIFDCKGYETLCYECDKVKLLVQMNVTLGE